MNSFNKTVIIIASIILITILIILAISLSKTLFNESFPPIIPDCPDYWEVEYNNSDQAKCINNNGINTGNTDLQDCGDFTNFFDRNSDQGNCERYKWSKKCNVNWDGITNNTFDFCNN